MERHQITNEDAVGSPLFSIVVPLYNKQSYVAATLASVFAQTLTNYEVIIIDDGSTDASVAQLVPYRDRITVSAQQNRGPGLARNRAAELARGPWLVFLDADDLWEPDHLHALQRLILNHPDCDVVASAFEHFWNGVRVRRKQTRRSADKRIHYLEEPHARSALFTSSTAVRTSTFRAVGGFGPVWPGEDSDLWIRLALRGPFAFTATVSVRYMQNGDGLMGQGKRSAGASDDARHTPAMRTLDLAISNELQPRRKRVLITFRDQLLISAAKVAIFEGRHSRAATYLRHIRRQSLISLAYRGLAACPTSALLLARSILKRRT